MAKHSVLVADADPRSLRILEVALRKAGFTVGTASDGPEALRRIQRAPPDLVLSEVQLPGADGFALCKSVRSDPKLAHTPFLLMTSDRSQAVRMRASELGADDFLLKPLLIKELVGRVRMLLESRDQQRLAQRGAPSGSMTGAVADLGLLDLFQSLENWRKTALVTCESQGRTARVWVRDGQIIDAELLPLQHEAAFYRLLNWDSGEFRVDFGPVERDRQIDGGTQTMLLEGMRRVDEVARMAERVPMETAFTVDTPALLTKLQDLPDEVNGVIRLFDGRRTLQQVLEVSPIDDLSTLAIVERLLSQAILVRPEPRSLIKPSLSEWLGSPGGTMLPPGDVSAPPPPFVPTAAARPPLPVAPASEPTPELRFPRASEPPASLASEPVASWLAASTPKPEDAAPGAPEAAAKGSAAARADADADAAARPSAGALSAAATTPQATAPGNPAEAVAPAVEPQPSVAAAAVEAQPSVAAAAVEAQPAVAAVAASAPPSVAAAPAGLDPAGPVPERTAFFAVPPPSASGSGEFNVDITDKVRVPAVLIEADAARAKESAAQVEAAATAQREAGAVAQREAAEREATAAAQIAAAAAAEQESVGGSPALAAIGSSTGIERILFPPLRGVRRERLRREADEVRAAVGAGRPVRLVHALELPPWTEDGLATPPPGHGRRVSPAVSEEAKRLTSNEALAIPQPRKPGASKPSAQPKPTLVPEGVPDERSDVAIEAVRLGPTGELAVITDPAVPRLGPPGAPEQVAAGANQAPAAPTAVEAGAAQAAPAPRQVEASAAQAAAPRQVEAAPAQVAPASSQAEAGAKAAEPIVAQPRQKPVAEISPADEKVRPSRHLGLAAEEDEVTPAGAPHLGRAGSASSRPAANRWPLIAAVAAVAVFALWFFGLRGPRTDKKDAPWLEGAQQASAAKASKEPKPAAKPSLDAAGVAARDAAGARDAESTKAAAAPAKAPTSADARPPVEVAQTDPAPAEPARTAPPPEAAPAEDLPPEPVKPKAKSSKPEAKPGKAETYSKSMTAGEALLKRGKYKQAVAEFKKAVESNGSSVPALLSLGDAFLEADQPKQALEPLAKAARLDSRSGRAQLLLGTAHQSLQHNKDAIAAYKRYLELDPSGEFARDVRSILSNLTK